MVYTSKAIRTEWCLAGRVFVVENGSKGAVGPACSLAVCGEALCHAYDEVDRLERAQRCGWDHGPRTRT